MKRALFDSSRTGGILCGVVFGLACTALGTQAKNYGPALFLAVPFVTGFVAAWIDALDVRRSLGECFVSALLPLGVASSLFLVLGLEGLICIAMAAVIGIPLGMAGGALAYKLQRHRAVPGASLMAVVLLPLTLLLGHHGPRQDTDTVTTSIVVEAPPEAVWPHVQSFAGIGPPENFLFRAGVAYPVAARTDGAGVGAARECILSTGVMTERVTVWEPPRRLAFDVLTTPVAMRELSPWPNLDLPHLHGFYISKRGEFRLKPLPGNRTLVEGQSWYRHGLAPVAYWNLWSRYIVHNVHQRVLNHVKTLAEADVKRMTQVAREFPPAGRSPDQCRLCLP